MTTVERLKEIEKALKVKTCTAGELQKAARTSQSALDTLLGYLDVYLTSRDRYGLAGVAYPHVQVEEKPMNGTYLLCDGFHTLRMKRKDVAEFLGMSTQEVVYYYKSGKAKAGWTIDREIRYADE